MDETRDIIIEIFAKEGMDVGTVSPLQQTQTPTSNYNAVKSTITQ